MSGSRLDPEGFGGNPKAAAKAVTFLKTLSHAGRLQILCLLLDQDLSVGALAKALLSSCNVSVRRSRVESANVILAAIISVMPNSHCDGGKRCQMLFNCGQIRAGNNGAELPESLAK